MNFLDWLQITFSLVAALIGLYIAFARPSGRRVLATTRIGSVGVALLGLSYFVGGFEGPLSKLSCSPSPNRSWRWWGSW